MENIGHTIPVSQYKRGVVTITVKKKQAPDGHKWRIVHKITIILILLSSFFGSTHKNSNINRLNCLPKYIEPHVMPHQLPFSKPRRAGNPCMNKWHLKYAFHKSRRHVSPTNIGHTLVSISIDMNVIKNCSFNVLLGHYPLSSHCGSASTVTSCLQQHGARLPLTIK